MAELAEDIRGHLLSGDGAAAYQALAMLDEMRHELNANATALADLVREAAKVVEIPKPAPPASKPTSSGATWPETSAC